MLLAGAPVYGHILIGHIVGDCGDKLRVGNGLPSDLLECLDRALKFCIDILISSSVEETPEFFSQSI